MKLNVFPDSFQDQSIREDRLIDYLENVKSRLSIVKFTGNDDGNILYKDTIILTKIVQKLWNELEDLKEKYNG